MQSTISTLETENAVLKNKLKKSEQTLAELEEEVTFLKGRSQKSELKQAPVVHRIQPRPEITSVDQTQDALFEEDIAPEQETLVFTNKDLEKMAWGEPAKTTQKNQDTPVSQAKKDYDAAYHAFQRKDYDQSRALMLGFIDRYPKHEYTDNAHFWIGETYYVREKYQEADVYYKNVIRDFPKGNKVPDAMYRAAACAMKQSKTSIAKQSLEILIQKYPTTVAAAKAKKTLETLK
ncbi:MAG: tol-pal system protein YbgF [Bdellovibrionota bacterium]